MGDGVFTIILPTLNEAGNIVPMIESLSSLYPSSKILVLDDNSSDGTRDRVLSRYPSSDRVRVIRRDPSDKGLTASITEGILNAKTKYFVVMDADFQHPPESVDAIVSSLQEGHDLTVGVREDKLSMMFYRQFASWGAHAMAKTYLIGKRQPRSRDTMSGFFGGDTEVCQNIIREHSSKFERQGFKALFDILKFAPRDISIGEIIFKFNSRRSGESKLSSRVVLSIMRQCGVAGKTMAMLATFFLLSTFGRLVAALLLGVSSTFLAIVFTGELSPAVFSNMILSLISAILFMVAASELIMSLGGRDTIAKGLLIVSVATMGYLLNAYVFYWLNESLLAVAVLPSMLGITVAFGFELIGSRFHSRPAIPA